MKIRPYIILGSAVLMTAAGAGAFAQATFTPLGDLAGSSVESTPWAISDNGLVVTGHSRTENGLEAFRWTADTGIVALAGLPAGILSRSGNGISADGSVIVGASELNGHQAFYWSESNGGTGLGYLPGGAPDSVAFDTSADGSVVVGFSKSENGNGANEGEAFRWSALDGMTGLGDLPGGLFRSAAVAVSADGSVVAGFATEGDSTHRQAIRWTQDTGMIGLGYLPGDDHSIALDLSADGSVIVGSSGGRAFRWTAERGMVDLGELAGFDAIITSATGVSRDGSVVVGRSAPGEGDGKAFYWTESTGMIDLFDVLIAAGADLTGWTLLTAEDVSGDGLTVVGVGRNPQNAHEAWIATIPEPSAIVLAALAATILLCRRWNEKPLSNC